MDKSAEAKKYLKEGDEALKTGMFKWSKDYASAAINYDEAAKLYRLSKQYDQAQAVYEKLINVNDKMNDPWAVARTYENIVAMAMDRADGVKMPADKLLNFSAKAGQYFRMANSPNSYVTLVKKVAKYLDERGDLAEALNLYRALLNDLQDDEQYHLHTEIVTAYASVLMKVQKYPETLELFEREYIYKKGVVTKSGAKQNLDTLALTIVVLNLILGDIEKAEKRLSELSIEIKDFFKTPEFDVSDKLVNAYSDGNQADFDKSAQRGVLNSIFPLNIIKELRKVKVQASTKKKVMEINDYSEDFKSNKYAGESEETTSVSQNVSQPLSELTEEQRQKALNDMLC